MGAHARTQHLARALKARVPRRAKVAVKKGLALPTTASNAARDKLMLRRERRAFRDLTAREALPPVDEAPVRLLVGPANFAGQGELWARSASQFVPGVTAHSFTVLKDKLNFPTTYSATAEQVASTPWQRAHFEHVTATYTHVLIEAERPLFGSRYGQDPTPQIAALRTQGLHLGLLAHGSDVRIPSVHAERYPWSPFRTSDWDIVPVLEAKATRNASILQSFDGPVLVSTPDLLDDVPNARWCPVVVDVDLWSNEDEPMGRERPIVAHAPTSGRMKGSDVIDPVVQRLADEGLVDYRRIEGIPPEGMVEVVRTADIVLDQFRLGSYGVVACEAMAASRAVLGHVAPHVRDRVRDATGLDLPIIEATPDTVESVLRELIAEPQRVIESGRDGRAFVERVHTGRMSADALTPFLAETGAQ